MDRDSISGRWITFLAQLLPALLVYMLLRGVGLHQLTAPKSKA